MHALARCHVSTTARKNVRHPIPTRARPLERWQHFPAHQPSPGTCLQQPLPSWRSWRRAQNRPRAGAARCGGCGAHEARRACAAGLQQPYLLLDHCHLPVVVVAAATAVDSPHCGTLPGARRRALRLRGRRWSCNAGGSGAVYVFAALATTAAAAVSVAASSRGALYTGEASGAVASTEAVLTGSPPLPGAREPPPAANAPVVESAASTAPPPFWCALPRAPAAPAAARGPPRAVAAAAVPPGLPAAPPGRPVAAAAATACSCNETTAADVSALTSCSSRGVMLERSRCARRAWFSCDLAHSRNSSLRGGITQQP
eukprot:357326-Chlamydomonas_euryale.AAC.3